MPEFKTLYSKSALQVADAHLFKIKKNFFTFLKC